MLLESIIAIALITVLMIALTSLFISAMQTTAHQRATQGAIRIATDQIDQARGLSASGALSGRDKTSVQRQFAAAPASVLPWLSSSAVQAFDGGATSGAGDIACPQGTTGTGCAALPTTPVSRTISTIAYQLSYYLQWCHLDGDGVSVSGDGGDGDSPSAAADDDPDCADTAVSTDSALRQYVRVVVAISWTDASCPTAGCHYITSVMLSTDADPMFYFRNPPPPAPKVDGCDPQAGVVGQEVDLAIVGTDGLCGFSGGVPPVTWGGENLPPGLAVIAAGRITGTPTEGGTFTGTLTATDAFLRTSSDTITWTVTYPPLTATNPGPQADTVDMPITPLKLETTGGSGTATFTVQSGTLPAGLALADNTVTGTPTSAGTGTVTFLATDDEAKATDTVAVTWTVNPPPSVSPPPNTTTAPGGEVSAQAVGTAGTAPYTFALQNAPAWLQIDPDTGVLSGTADSAILDYPDITITLTDARGAVATSAPFTWSVYEVPTLVPPGDQASDLGAAVSLQLGATCGVEPCTFAADGLPDWLSIDPATGLISGTAPSTGGLVTGITVSITDGRGTRLSSIFSWLVGPQQTISTPDDQVWTVGQPLQSATSEGLQISAECTAAPCSYGLAPGSGPLPSGLLLSASTGMITGTPQATGTWNNIILMVRNHAGVPAQADPISWTINPPPTLAAPGNQRTALGGSVSLSLTHDCRSEPCSFTSTSLPEGLTLHDDGSITGTATAGPQYTVTVSVADKTGAVASRTFTWYVLGITNPPNVTLTEQGGSGKCLGDNQTQNLLNVVTGYSPDITFSVDRTDLMKVTGSTLSLVASCTKSVTATITITARDAGGSAPAVTVSTTFVLKIQS